MRPAIPDVPTFKELGYNVVAVGSAKGVAAPKGTPPEVIGCLIGQPVMYQGPQEFGKYLKDGFEQYGKLIKEFNIKLE